MATGSSRCCTRRRCGTVVRAGLRLCVNSRRVIDHDRHRPPNRSSACLSSHSAPQGYHKPAISTVWFHVEVVSSLRRQPVFQLNQ